MCPAIYWKILSKGAIFHDHGHGVMNFKQALNMLACYYVQHLSRLTYCVCFFLVCHHFINLLPCGFSLLSVYFANETNLTNVISHL